MGLTLVPAAVYCSCGCGTMIFQRDTQLVTNLAERPKFKCGELAYIELFVPGHEPGGKDRPCR